MTPHEAALLIRVREAVATGRALELRRSARLRPAEMADLVLVPVPTLTAWEAGRRMPTGAAAIRYAKALAVLEEQRVAASAAAS
jgi:DNA-binding transcriptional regulator YiaG